MGTMISLALKMKLAVVQLASDWRRKHLYKQLVPPPGFHVAFPCCWSPGSCMHLGRGRRVTRTGEGVC